jgi:tetratricopeptide (TPR) repeat protein
VSISRSLAATCSARQEYEEATDFFDFALKLVRATGEDERAVDRSIELKLLAQLASHYFLLGRFDLSSRSLHEAQTLAGAIEPPSAPPSQPPLDQKSLETIRLSTAAVAWTRALSHRWQGKLDEAYHQAESALGKYETLGSVHSRSRLHVVIADILLDKVDATRIDTTATEFDLLARSARSHTTQALSLTAAAPDPAGEGMALLTLARLSRLVRWNESRHSLIESVIRRARALSDAPLLAQAYTALGEEFAVQAEHESAMTCFRIALDMLKHSDATAMAVWPRRALLRASEMSQ